MRAVSCFNYTMHFHGIDVVSGKSAIMSHIYDARALFGDGGGKVCQTARPITDHSRKTAETSVGGESAFDDSSQDSGVNVPSGKKKDNFFATEFRKKTSQTCGQRCGSGAFDH